jgi:hypothetical protein
MGRKPYAIWKKRYAKLVSRLPPDQIVVWKSAMVGAPAFMRGNSAFKPSGSRRTLPLRLQPRGVTVFYFPVDRGFPFSSTPVLVTGPMPTNSNTAGSPPALAPSQCTVFARSMAKVPAGNG